MKRFQILLSISLTCLLMCARTVQAQKPCDVYLELGDMDADAAMNVIMKTLYSVEEETYFDSESWIYGLTYKGCGNGFGALLMHTPSGTYVFDRVPQDFYEEWARSEVPGSFYHERMKGNFMSLKHGPKKRCTAINAYNDLRCERGTYSGHRCWQHRN